jgi:DNA-binding MarR family transcriptional regulator
MNAKGDARSRAGDDAAARLASIPASCLGMASRAASRAATRVFSAHLRDLDLEATQFPILLMLRIHGPQGMAPLAALLDLDASTLTRNAQRLARKGLVASHGGRGRNGKRLSLTASGIAALDQASAKWRAAQDAIDAELGAESAHALRGSLRRLEEAANRAEIKVKAAGALQP